MRHIAATEWVTHIADVKVLSAKRLTRLKWTGDGFRGWGPVTLGRGIPHLDGTGFRAGGYFWRFSHAATLGRYFWFSKRGGRGPSDSVRPKEIPVIRCESGLPPASCPLMCCGGGNANGESWQSGAKTVVTVAAESLLAQQRLLMSVGLNLHQVLASQRDSDAAQGH